MPAEEVKSNPANAAEPEKPFFSVIVHSFFIVPFLIAVFCVLLFAAITLLTSERQTVYDLLEDVKAGGTTKRWQAAFELSKILANRDLVPKDQRFINELKSAFNASTHDDSRVRQYLALAMGRTGQTDFVDTLLTSLKTEKEENMAATIYALGMLREKRAANTLNSFVSHPNGRIRSVAVTALGAIADPASKEFLKKALNDPEPNVQWGSALSLAQMGDASGKEIIIKLLNRNYLQSFVEVDPHEVNHILLTTIQSVDTLNDKQINDAVSILAESDSSMKVRSAAMEYMQAQTK